MGLFWSSKQPSQSPPEDFTRPPLSSSDLPHSTDLLQDAAIHPPTNGGTTQPKTPPSSRDDLANAELQSILAELNAEDAATTAAEQRASDMGSAFHEEGRQTVYPTEMSCVTAFDELFYCYSLGGQLQNGMHSCYTDQISLSDKENGNESANMFGLVYRYGTYRDCSQKGKNFRFCMKSKMYGQAKRRDMILEHYKTQEAKVKSGASSEDVWEIRKTPLIETKDE